MSFERLWHAFVMAFVGTLCVLFVGLIGTLIVSIAHEQQVFDSLRHVYTVGNRVYEGETLIGTCGGNPPAPASIPPDSDRVDVTWYPECPR